MGTSQAQVNLYLKPLSMVSIGLVILGILFKIQHWPLASLLILIGFVIQIGTQVARLATGIGVRWRVLGRIVVIVWFFLLLTRRELPTGLAPLLPYLHSIGRWPVIAWLAVEAFVMVKNRMGFSVKEWRVYVFALSAALVLLGALGQNHDWPGSTIALFAGLGLGAGVFFTTKS